MNKSRMEKKIPKNKNRHVELEEHGWMRRFVADEPRLSEAVQLYESLGYEVRLEPVALDETNKECRTCLIGQNCDRYRTIYIRARMS